MIEIFRKYVFYFIILSSLTPCFTEDKNVGDSCKLPIRGTGICKKTEDCPRAAIQQSIGIKPNICNRKKGIVVCCQDKQRRTNGNDGPQAIAKSVNVPSVSNLRKNEQKCVEYSTIVQDDVVAAPLSIDRSFVSTSRNSCPFELKPLIVGGSLAEYGEYPHMALLGTGDPPKWLCGGSLISEEFVLTAAHCYLRDKITVVRLGELNIAKPESNSEPQDFKVAEFIKNPSYNPPKVFNDIALIRLAKRVTFTTYMRPACLWNKFEIFQNVAIATGWGIASKENENINDDLLKVGLNIIDLEKCKQMYMSQVSIRLPVIRHNLICASNASGGDTCQGDSGGPIQINHPENECIHYVIGVTSAGKGCGNTFPGLYTRVSDFIDWIESTVWPN